MKKEIWKDIEDWEEMYQISNYGRVRSLNKTVIFKNDKGSRDYKGKILKNKYHNGYPTINLNRNKNCVTYSIHRLVASAFVSKDCETYNVVNHIDGVKSNNHYKNLEWCDHQYNTQHAIDIGLVESGRKKVAMIKNDKIFRICDHSRELAKWLLKTYDHINASENTVSRSIRKSAQKGSKYHGFTFQYID